MTSSTETTAIRPYDSARRCAELAGMSCHKFLRYVALGKVRVKAEIGELPKYSTEDSAKLKEAAE